MRWMEGHGAVVFGSHPLHAVDACAAGKVGHADKRLCLVGLPNDRIPTNHLPIAASFEMRGHPQLCDGSRRRLIERLIEGRHLVETKDEDN
jgi:hypothetical protein